MKLSYYIEILLFPLKSKHNKDSNQENTAGSVGG